MEQQPIMSEGEQRFMAFEGLVQWTQAVVDGGNTIAKATAKQRTALKTAHDRHTALLKVHTACHYFSIAAYKLIEHREWVGSFGLCASMDFSVIDAFSVSDLRDLRNMREHVVDYFRGMGRARTRWVVETPEFSADLHRERTDTARTVGDQEALAAGELG